MAQARDLFSNMGVQYDGYDISLDSGFRDALRERLGGKMKPVPQLFIGDKYIGGIQEITIEAEEGNIQKMMHSQGRTRGRIYSLVENNPGSNSPTLQALKEARQQDVDAHT